MKYIYQNTSMNISDRHSRSITGRKLTFSEMRNNSITYSNRNASTNVGGSPSLRTPLGMENHNENHLRTS